MLPAIAFALGHILADLLKDAAVFIDIFKQMAKSIIAALHLTEDVLWGMKASFFIHI